MGKGDIKTRRGKFFAGSFGKLRPKHNTKIKYTPPPAKEEKEEVAESAKATVQKAVPGTPAPPKVEVAENPKKTPPKNTGPKQPKEKKDESE